MSLVTNMTISHPESQRRLLTPALHSWVHHSNATKKEASRVPQFFVFGLKGWPAAQNNQPSTEHILPAERLHWQHRNPGWFARLLRLRELLARNNWSRTCQKGQTKFHQVELEKTFKTTPITKRHIFTTCGQVSTCNLIDVPQCMKHHSNHPPLSHINAATDPEVQSAEITYSERGGTR